MSGDELKLEWVGGEGLKLEWVGGEGLKLEWVWSISLTQQTEQVGAPHLLTTCTNHSLVIAFGTIS